MCELTLKNLEKALEMIVKETDCRELTIKPSSILGFQSIESFHDFLISRRGIITEIRYSPRWENIMKLIAVPHYGEPTPGYCLVLDQAMPEDAIHITFKAPSEQPAHSA